MNENQQDAAGSKRRETDNTLWIPPLSTKNQKKLDRLRKKPFAQRMGFAGKTPWDFIQLLLIPLVLTGVGYGFSLTQTQISFQMSERQHQTDLQIAEDQQRETTLETYLDNMSDLLLNHNLSKSKPGDAVSQIARERTLATLRRLDASRNRIVLQFLRDAHLFSVQNATIDLSSANLSGDDLTDANLTGTHLTDANLTDIHLAGANLTSADLTGDILTNANLAGANLTGAKLNYANLTNVDLTGTQLAGTDLSGTHLTGANLTGANLTGANLSGTIITQEQLAKATQQAQAPTQTLIPALHSSYAGIIIRLENNQTFTLLISSLIEKRNGEFRATGSVGSCPTIFQGAIDTHGNIAFSATETQTSNCGSVGSFTGVLFSDSHLTGTWVSSRSQESGIWEVF